MQNDGIRMLVQLQQRNGRYVYNVDRAVRNANDFASKRFEFSCSLPPYSAEADNSDGQIADASEPVYVGRPSAFLHLSIEPRDAAVVREHQGDCMIRHLRRAVVRYVSHPGAPS